MESEGSRQQQFDLGHASNSQRLQSVEDSMVPPAVHPGHSYSVVNISGNAKAILGNVNGELNPNFLAHASETDRKLLILRNLYYNGMLARKLQITAKAGSPRSVEWIWTTSFATWLQTTDTLYWITGQPGSGKSSLMKHLSESRRTLDVLRQSGHDWTILHFYFDFRAEDRTANRIDGMLRTFLHQFVKQVPSLAEQVDPETILMIGRLSLHELLGLFTELLESGHAKICAFIDGLDEFRGSSSELLDVIDILGDRASSYMKICLASRPELIFEQRLSKYPHLAVQNHNDESIQYYTEMVWQSQRIDSSAKVPVVLSDAIRRKARGNFLWARLGMDLAVQGLLAGNSIKELLDQVNEMPEGVQEMYKLTLQRLPQMLRMEAMLLLYLIVSAGGALELRKLYTGLATAITKARLQGQLLPVEHDSDNASRITSLLGSFVDVVSKSFGALEDFFNLEPPRTCVRLDAGCRLHLLGSNPYRILVKLNHETLQAYFSQSTWLRDNLPFSFNQIYPDSFWLRAYANELSTTNTSDNAFAFNYGQSVVTYILNIKAHLFERTSSSHKARLEAYLVMLLRYWSHWTPLLPYALDEFFDEVKGYCQRENRLHDCYGEVVNSIAVIMHCALCLCQRIDTTSLFYGCLSGHNLHWKTGFVDLRCLETWSIYASANHAIPEAITWHLENGRALAEEGSPRIQLLLTEILYKYCEASEGTPIGYRKLLPLLVAKGARFDTRHVCNLICKDAQCTFQDQADICDLMARNTSSNIDQGHSHWCDYHISFSNPASMSWEALIFRGVDPTAMNWWRLNGRGINPRAMNWGALICRGDTVGKKRISGLLKLLLGFDIVQSATEQNTILHYILLNPCRLPSNKMLKVVEALKAGVNPQVIGLNSDSALDYARASKKKLNDRDETHWNSFLKREFTMIIELLEYIESHEGALPTNLDFYESFNCWVKEVKSDGHTQWVLATGTDRFVLRGPDVPWTR